MIGFVVFIIMISCAIYWLAHTGALLKLHETLGKISNVNFLYIGMIIILVVKMAGVISGMELFPGESQSSEISNKMREGVEVLSVGLLYLGMGFVVFSFVIKIFQGKKKSV